MRLIKLLNESGMDLSLAESYLSELIKDDREVFESTKEFLPSHERKLKENKIRNGRILLSIIRHSLK